MKVVGFSLRWEASELGSAAATTPVERNPQLTTTRTPFGYRIQLADLGAFLVDELGTEIVVQPSGRCTRDDLEGLFKHAIVPRLPQLRGTPSLHASAVAIDGVCVGFFGPSGKGKSTLAASLAARWPLVADDALMVTFVDGSPFVLPSAPTSRLRDDSADYLQLEDNSNLLYGKWIAPVSIASAPVPLVALYLLDEAPVTSTKLLSQRDALLAIAGHLHRLDPHDPELLAKEVSFLETIVQQVPVRRLLYPRQFERIAEVADVLLKDLEDDRALTSPSEPKS